MAWAGWSYDALSRRLAGGETPTVVMRLAKCTGGEKFGQAGFAVVRFQAWNVIDRWIATSDNHLFLSSKTGAMTLQYVRLRLTPDGGARVYLRQLDPTTFRPLEDATELACGTDSEALTFVSPGN